MLPTAGNHIVWNKQSNYSEQRQAALLNNKAQERAEVQIKSAGEMEKQSAPPVGKYYNSYSSWILIPEIHFVSAIVVVCAEGNLSLLIFIFFVHSLDKIFRKWVTKV